MALKKEVPYENCEYLVRLLKKRNFDHQFIWGIALSTDSDELLGELASFIEENVGWDEFLNDDEDNELHS